MKVRPLLRSIPACAGEPRHIRRRRRPAPGLSPRVRGNPWAGIVHWSNQRSIPACAGEPSPIRSPRQQGESIPACAGEPKFLLCSSGQTQVYPRVCGGTRGSWRRCSWRKGLSPRVRGNRNHIRQPHTPVYRRSIPACAGEPLLGVWIPQPNKVYPRVCGGTVCQRTLQVLGRGLSPRVRGNPSI